MQIYKVGGAVRDRLLGRPVSDIDWVVVGASAEAMQAQGFRPVGADFPVFLHPDSGEEYALARTERKSGQGYGGFTFHASPDVTLEEDLIRTHFRKAFEGEAGIFVTAADILEQISSCLRYPLSPNKIGRIMAGLEFESIRYKGKRGYIAVKKTGEDIDRERRSGALGL